MSAETVENDFKPLTAIDLFNRCNAFSIDNRPPECEDYNYFLPKFELKLFNVDETTNAITPILDKQNIQLNLELMDINNQIVSGVRVSRLDTTNNPDRPFVYEIVSDELNGSVINRITVPTLKFTISNSGTLPVNKYELHIFKNDINEAPMHTNKDPSVSYGTKDLSVRNMTADITITAGRQKYDASSKVEKITLIDSSEAEFSSDATKGKTFNKSTPTTVTAYFDNMKVGNTFRKIKIKVGSSDGINLARIQGEFKNDDGTQYASFDKQNLNKWIKGGSHTVDIGKSITVPEGKVTDFDNITLMFDVTDKQLSGTENFTVYTAGKKNMNDEVKQHLSSINTYTTPIKVETFKNKLNYSKYNAVEGFTNFNGGVLNTTNSDEIKQIHNNVIVQQAELDKNISELKKDKNSIYMENQRRYDRTMFGGIVTTILASSLVYYMFTDM
jgi:hypothetical protein